MGTRRFVPQTLILYATTEGQTARIAERVAQVLKNKGHAVDVFPADAYPAIPDPGSYDSVIICASIHYGKHPAYLRKLVRHHVRALAERPCGFVSVSLSAGGPGARPEAAQRYMRKFLRQTGWSPGHAVTIAGALPYSKYGPIKRLIMRGFVGFAGGDTDASRDYEYTDWSAVEAFAGRFTQLAAEVYGFSLTKV